MRTGPTHTIVGATHGSPGTSANAPGEAPEPVEGPPLQRYSNNDDIGTSVRACALNALMGGSMATVS